MRLVVLNSFTKITFLIVLGFGNLWCWDFPHFFFSFNSLQHGLGDCFPSSFCTQLYSADMMCSDEWGNKSNSFLADFWCLLTLTLLHLDNLWFLRVVPVGLEKYSLPHKYILLLLPSYLLQNTLSHMSCWVTCS